MKIIFGYSFNQNIWSFKTFLYANIKYWQSRNHFLRLTSFIFNYMGYPLGPIFKFHILRKTGWKKCPIKFKPSFYRMYVDDILVLSKSSESADSFCEYMSSKHQNINFAVEKKNVASLSFLDVKICRKNSKFVTSVYRTPTFSGVYTNYESFIPPYQKKGLLHTLLHRSFSICCDFKIFHFEIDSLKTILIKNN